VLVHVDSGVAPAGFVDVSVPMESVVYVVPGKMGGVTTNLANLQANCDHRAFHQHTILTFNRLEKDTPFTGPMNGDGQSRFMHALPLENVHSVLRRLRREVPRGGGVLVASDWLELALVSRYGTDRAVLQILHGDYDYYFDLAVKHEAVVDCYVTCSRAIREKLAQLLPHRADEIRYIPYGVPNPTRTRRTRRGPLRVLFAGRLEQAGKRIFDLVEIDRTLRERNVELEWTVAGAGPDEEELRARWTTGRVRWAGLLSNAETIQLMAENDVFILPSRAEGLPVALLEAMSVGVVPVSSDVSGGIREIVVPGQTGVLIPVGDVRAFCECLISLDGDREHLETLSRGARRKIEDGYDLPRQAAEYQSLYAEWRSLRRPRSPRARLQYGSRLDRPWIPNAFVRFVRERTRPELSALLRSNRLTVA
jgi:glycosyltransferase involved in cell wall biosynthesis